uniref:NADH dehydrogenase [ubiquinone] 1 alpha subcomplex subunit 10, mitochondrial-like n=1 Tax=Phallusia mammillata TaxID=59560 RepID=A0A6F9DMV2_9ASCI|nr:NADH dehydrogenase [ubiquinone] 1 alpha subcomplex subunit 10, mitochondrial-like [Phallusia mammillata]
MLNASRITLRKCMLQKGSDAAKIFGLVVQQKVGYATLGEFIQKIRFNYFDNPRHHLDNDKWNKFFCVEGNMSSGKSKFAKELAEKLPVKLFPQATTNYDLIRLSRTYPDEKVEWNLNPKSVMQKSRILSEDKLWTDPTDWVHTFRYQQQLTCCRFHQYRDAMINILEKGEGVVMVQHFHSDVVRADAQRKMAWIDKKYWDYYDLFHYHADENMLPPQVILYLDVPAERCYENIQAGDNEAEKNIPLDYLKHVERIYKTKFLPKCRDKGVNVITLDWSNGGDIEDVVEQLDDMPSLLAPDHWWDGSNNYYRQLLNLLYNDAERSRRLGMYCPFEETWQPLWMLDAHSMEENLAPGTYHRGFNSKLGDKWVFLKS